MKKFFAILLAALMLLPCIVACGKTPDNEESTSSTTESSTVNSTKPTTGSSNSGTNSTDSSNTPAGSTGSTNGGGQTPDKEPETEPVVVDKWRDQTLDVLATVWHKDVKPGAPWAVPELCVKRDGNGYFDDTGFGQVINSAILEREDFIKETYGVEINWINARDNHISSLLSTSIVSGKKYHIAMPRMLEAQAIVAANSIFNLADREYIDLDRSYYNQVSREAYTVYDKTLFIAGDFSFLDEQTSYMVYYNVSMTEKDGLKESFPDLYQKVIDGKWTISEMTNVAKLVSKNVGSADWTDEDTYGYGTTSLGKFFQYSGIQQVSVNEAGTYEITLNDSRVSDLISKMLEIAGATWARTEWTGGYEALEAAFAEGRLLFYTEVVEKAAHFTNQTDDFKVGVLPAPKLSESQESYYTPCSYMATLMCIPKATADREMSEYFFEILSYTGQKYLMSAYRENLVSKLYAETATQSTDILENYIFANLTYDQGYMYDWNGLLSKVQNEAYNTGKNNFTQAYGLAYDEASAIVANWNLNWLDSNDDIE